MARGEGGPLEPGDLGYRPPNTTPQTPRANPAGPAGNTGRFSDPLKNRFGRSTEISRGRGFTALKRRSLIGRGRQPGSLIGDFDPLNLQYLIDE